MERTSLRESVSGKKSAFDNCNFFAKESDCRALLYEVVYKTRAWSKVVAKIA